MTGNTPKAQWRRPWVPLHYAFANASHGRTVMIRRQYSWIAAGGVVSAALAGFALFHTSGVKAQGQYPVMDNVANMIVQKYQNSTCEQLWEKKSAHAPLTMEQTRIVTFLHDDANMRAAFMKIVAPPIVNKMFDCGLIP
jgi:hypothetical protein